MIAIIPWDSPGCVAKDRQMDAYGGNVSGRSRIVVWLINAEQT